MGKYGDVVQESRTRPLAAESYDAGTWRPIPDGSSLQMNSAEPVGRSYDTPTFSDPERDWIGQRLVFPDGRIVWSPKIRWASDGTWTER